MNRGQILLLKELGVLLHFLDLLYKKPEAGVLLAQAARKSIPFTEVATIQDVSCLTVPARLVSCKVFIRAGTRAPLICFGFSSSIQHGIWGCGLPWFTRTFPGTRAAGSQSVNVRGSSSCSCSSSSGAESLQLHMFYQA